MRGNIPATTSPGPIPRAFSILAKRADHASTHRALDEERAKREFWTAFRVLGQWWADLPPY